ncbi:kinesin-like protein KIF20A isoform X1 [Gadus morhua]|uniref:kinesin-like protein KIF20A isoform X1 n=1 Tax=Gadus morhua TaxID=8049 RepID=UPI0011B57896|nr:kinesin-like protein KIF20A isoform X1 [Gadus morhua]
MRGSIKSTDEETTRPHSGAVLMESQSPCDVLPVSSLNLQRPTEVPRLTSIGSGQSEVESQPQTLQVYLRVRPFFKEELSDKEDQGCVVIEDSQVVKLHAPKGSATLKSSERGIGVAVHKFSFTQIFGEDTSQNDLYVDTVESQVSDYLAGQNALIFSYGVTNAGKTYTIQGTAKDPGILPRVLGTTFQHIGRCQYGGMDLKPYLATDAQCLGPEQVKLEMNARAAIFATDREPLKPDGVSAGCLPPAGQSSTTTDDDAASMESGSTETGDFTFTLWVACYEIYNESVYDLLQTTSGPKSKKRATLRVCEDRAGSAYVRDLKWINIHSLEEANALLQFGNKNRSAASTKMNQSSSRSHSIFTMKLLKINGNRVERISEFSLCDLAGSERCNKTKTLGERLKEAGNINNSLLILGKCITALRNKNLTDNRTRSCCIPFRESKLTKLFQGFFCGKGKASMIVNINQCASNYDETLHVMKFSAVAKQVVHVIPAISLESRSPCLLDRHGNPLLRTTGTDSPVPDGYVSEEELLDEEDDADVSILPQEDLLTVIENLRSKLLAERRKNMVQEMAIRKEMGDAMLQQLMESEELLSQQMVELKETHDDKLENTFEMYKEAFKEHAYQCALGRIGEDFVPVQEFIAEEEKVEALRRKLSELENLVSSLKPSTRMSTTDQSSQTVEVPLPNKGTEAGSEARYKRVFTEKCAVEKMCAEKQELIMALEKRLVGLNETLRTVHADYMDKSAELEFLRSKSEDQTKSIDDLLRENVDKDSEIALLKEEVFKLSQRSPVKTKPKRGLLANIRDSVSSPRSTVIGRTLRKNVRATPTVGGKPSS